jgi:hypothetical protein
VIHFVVAAGSPDAVRRLSSRLAPSLGDTGLFEGERIDLVGASQTWAAAATFVPDPTTRTRIAADPDSIVVVNGAAVARRGNQGDVADVALDAFRSGGTSAVATALGGTYNFVGVTPQTGLRAFSDFSTLYPLYWYQGPDFALLSNRSTTSAAVAESDGWDVRALAWVIGYANLFGAHMPAREVEHLRPGTEAQVDRGSGALRLVGSPTWVWPDASDGPGRDNLSDEEWEEATEALVANFALLHSFDGPLRLSLTGGKDSRLCLALAKAAGLGERIETFTAGGPGSPEVECAASVAHAAGVRHSARGASAPPTDAKVAAAPVFDPETTWRRLRQDAYRYEAVICGWSGLANQLRNATLSIKGFGGEFYRRGNAKQFRRKHVVSVDALAEMFVNYHSVHDPLEILQPDEAVFQRQWLRDWVYEAAKEVRLDVLPERFYVENRLGHWSGPLIQATPASKVVNPLLSSPAAKKNLELSMEARTSERFHFEVMRRAAPELVTVPFLSDTWADAIADDSPVDLPRDPYPSTVNATKRVLTQRNQGWPFLETQSKAIASLFKEASRETDMAAVCDMRKLRKVARHSARLKKFAEVKELFSGVGVALVLLGRTEPVSDRV